MAYDPRLAQRLRRILKGHRVRELEMFGGLAFMVRGRMCCGVIHRDLMLRVGPAIYDEILAHPRVREMDFTGRPLRGMVYVDPLGFRSDASLRRWVGHALTFVATAPVRQRRRASVRPRKSGSHPR